MTDTLPPASADSLRPITEPYLLVTVSIPTYLDERGQRFIDPLWAKDLVGHVRYIKHLTLASPARTGLIPKGFVPVAQFPALIGLTFIDLPAVYSTFQALLALPSTLSMLLRASRRTSVVHSAVAGWPIPASWIMVPLAKWLGKFCLVNVESAFWRLPPGLTAGWKARMRAQISEVLNRWCLGQAHIAFFTHQQYKNSLLPGDGQKGHVIHASWIDEANIMPLPLASALWDVKNSGPAASLKLIYVGRLTEEKGLKVLLRALTQIDHVSNDIHLDILGDGPLKQALIAQVQAEGLGHRVRLLGLVDYGAPLFELLQTYHALVVPSITDEQPRIVYDAYAQALPVLASNTVGNHDCIQEGITGKLVPKGDSQSLAQLFQWAVQHKADLRTMGLQALQSASALTHEEMHRQRWMLIRRALDDAR